MYTIASAPPPPPGPGLSAVSHVGFHSDVCRLYDAFDEQPTNTTNK